jgi:hypothetical protein
MDPLYCTGGSGMPESGMEKTPHQIATLEEDSGTPGARKNKIIAALMANRPYPNSPSPAAAGDSIPIVFAGNMRQQCVVNTFAPLNPIRPIIARIDARNQSPVSTRTSKAVARMPSPANTARNGFLPNDVGYGPKHRGDDSRNEQEMLRPAVQ